MRNTLCDRVSSVGVQYLSYVESDRRNGQIWSVQKMIFDITRSNEQNVERIISEEEVPQEEGEMVKYIIAKKPIESSIIRTIDCLGAVIAKEYKYKFISTEHYWIGRIPDAVGDARAAKKFFATYGQVLVSEKDRYDIGEAQEAYHKMLVDGIEMGNGALTYALGQFAVSYDIFDTPKL